MVFEQFKSSADDEQTSRIDSARIIEELGTTSLSSALKDAKQTDDQLTANQLFGSVFFVGAELPEQAPAAKADVSKGTDAVRDVDAQRSKIDDLQTKYGIFVCRIITPSKVECNVFQNDKLQFSTESSDLEAELRKQGFHELKDLGFDKDSAINDYFDYVKRHFGFNSIHIIQGTSSKFYFYDKDGKQVSDGSVLDLQKHIEKNGLSPLTNVEPPTKKTITHLPNGQTAIEYPDGSEVILNKDRQVACYTTARGDVMKPENAEGTKWRTGDGTSLEGKFSFASTGSITFEFADVKSALAKRTFSPPKGVEDTYRDGLKVNYVDGEVTKMLCSDGTKIALSNEDGRAYEITQKDGRVLTVKEERSGKLVSADRSKELSEADQLALQKRLGELYEKIGRIPDAIKHHQIVTNAAELQYVPGSLELVDHHKHLAELKLKQNDRNGADWHTKEVTELHRVSDYLGRVKGADDLMRLLIVTNALPANLKLDTTGKVVRLELNDAGKALEAIPGLRLPGTRDLSGIKAITLDGNKLKFEGEGTFKFKVPNTEILADFKLSNASCELSTDPKDPTKLRLSNFKGLSISAFGANLQPEHLTLSSIKNADGTDSLRIEFGKLIPAVASDKKVGSMDLANQGFATLVGTQVPDIPAVQFPMPAQVRLDRLFSEAINWTKAGDAKDAGKMFESIVGLYANTEVSNVFSDIKELKKSGDRIEITTTGRDLHSIGGLPLSWSAKVSANFLKEDGGKISLVNIEGAKVKLALPGDVADGLGIKNPMEIAFKEISLGEPDKEGNRIATIKTDSTLESVSIKVGPRFEPIKDKQGKITLDANLKRDDARASIKITADPEQLAKGDPANIEFSLSVTGGSDKVAQILQGFMGHELDPTVKELLNGVESVTKVGDLITINRKNESIHDKSGLKVHVAKSVSFRIDPKAANLELKDIRGINIVDLPDVAGKIYAHKMPIMMKYLSLSGANQAGERVLTMRADGVVSSATIYLDAAMKPKEIIAVVENPAKYLKESLGNRDLIAQKIDRATKGKSYAIRIKGDGSVDLDGLGGVGGVADMLLNGGDLVSVNGVAATVVGYIGTSATQGQAAADRGLGNKIVETFQGLFGR